MNHNAVNFNILILEIVSQTSKSKIRGKKLTSPHYFYAASTKVHPVGLDINVEQDKDGAACSHEAAKAFRCLLSSPRLVRKSNRAQIVTAKVTFSNNFAPV
jgi:hypothetical protein